MTMPIDRADDCIHLFEIDKSYAENLKKKRKLFREDTGTNLRAVFVNKVVGVLTQGHTLMFYFLIPSAIHKL